MSKEVKKTAPEAAEEKKVVTKYDKKMQKRKEEAEKAKKEELKSRITGIVIVALIAAFILSFPIRSAIALNSAYITVNGEKVTQVEFDYNYALAKISYLNSDAGYFVSMYMDVSTIDSQMYTDTLTFGDYFEQIAAEQIASTKALKAAAEAEGFTYDTTADYEAAMADMKLAAEAEGVSLKEYIKAVYGDLATESRIKGFMEEMLYTAAFYEKKADDLMPSTDEIAAYYEENKASYDSIDYHMSIVEADLPTTTTDAENNEVPYEPTEGEVATAMAKARDEAESAADTVAEDGEGYTNVNQQNTYINSLVTDFLFDETRQPGDTYIAEDTANNRYLVVSFDGRYRDETPSVDARVVISTTMDAQAMLDEWKSGAATEESFIELVGKYDESGATEGLQESIVIPVLPSEEMKEWLSDDARQAGDTFAINVEGEANYVLYYLEESDPSWQVYIRGDLLEEAMAEYMEEISASYTVEDPKGKLAYMQEAEASGAAE
ncbi:MAG: hypothetical protein IJX63_09920 [Lachnospiraceae bacterium]|nr:hypothetical protein [Lachnospiraceae bacterium]